MRVSCGTCRYCRQGHAGQFLGGGGCGLGADVAIEAVGTPATFELTASLVRPGGHIANIGVHGKPATLHLEDLFSRSVTITTGLVDACSTSTLLRLFASGHLDAGRFVTHHFRLDEIPPPPGTVRLSTKPARRVAPDPGGALAFEEVHRGCPGHPCP